MGIDQLSEPCRACGKPKRARQSCANCAAQERARLHAAGVGHRECWREFRGDGSAMQKPDQRRLEAAQDEARTQRKFAKLGTTANPTATPEFDSAALRRACEQIYRKPIPTLSTPDPRTRAGSTPLSQACAAAEEARRLTGVVPYAVATPRPEQPMLCWPERVEIRWFDPSVDCNQPAPMGRSHTCHWMQSVPTKHAAGWVLLSNGGQCWAWRVVDGVIVFDEAERMVREHGQKPHKPVCERHGATLAPCYLCKKEHEPPPVGAEVEYAVAVRHMQTSVAVRYQGPAGQCVYCWHKGELHYSFEGHFYKNVLDLDELGNGPWVRVADASTGPLSSDEHRRIQNLRSELRAKAGRLPDATTVPEAERELVWPRVGEECSWEVAECHMRRDSEVRYFHYAANGDRMYRMVDGQLKSAGMLGECDASFHSGYENTGTWRRVE